MKRSTPIGRWRAEWLEVTSSGRFLRYECVDTPRQLKRIVAQLALGAWNAEIAVVHREHRLITTRSRIDSWDPSIMEMPDPAPDPLFSRDERKNAATNDLRSGVMLLARAAVDAGLMTKHHARLLISAAEALLETGTSLEK